MKKKLFIITISFILITIIGFVVYLFTPRTYVGVLATPGVMIPEGYYPDSEILDSEMKTAVAIDIGKIGGKNDYGKVVRVKVRKTLDFYVNPFGDKSYTYPFRTKLISYEFLNAIPYKIYEDIDSKKVIEYLEEKYPCLLVQAPSRDVYDGKYSDHYYTLSLLDKAYLLLKGGEKFSWEIINEKVIYKVNMTIYGEGDLQKGEIELQFDGDTGEFIKEIISPENYDFCEASSSEQPNIQAKIAIPKDVEPLIYGEIKFIAPREHLGFIEALDKNTGEKLWELQIYKTIIDPALEEDVQWVFITKLKMATNGRLIVFDSNGKIYSVNIEQKMVEDDGIPSQEEVKQSCESQGGKTFFDGNGILTCSITRELLTQEIMDKCLRLRDLDCGGKFNTDNPNTSRNYLSKKWGISLDLPYNENWGECNISNKPL
ncbi:hypothetical protein HZA38_01770 [Candidatus Peregrinibacteria bacterium]|nr:hypothetical protein [Candidatus Peregrinibacteria bacterium]